MIEKVIIIEKAIITSIKLVLFCELITSTSVKILNKKLKIKILNHKKKKF